MCGFDIIAASKRGTLPVKKMREKTMTNNEKIIETLKSSDLIKSLFSICVEKMKAEVGRDDLEIVFDVAPYEGDEIPDVNKFLAENENFGIEVFDDAEYPEEDTVEMKVITNIQLCLQEMLDEK